MSVLTLMESGWALVYGPAGEELIFVHSHDAMLYCQELVRDQASGSQGYMPPAAEAASCSLPTDAEPDPTAELKVVQRWPHQQP